MLSARWIILPVIAFYSTSNCVELEENNHPCHDLTRCALKKCVKKPTLPLPTKENLIEYLLGLSNFACVFGAACSEQCRRCPHCKYTQDQIKRFILNQKTDGLCPNLESCAARCVKEELTKDPFGCVFKRNCARYCYDESECSPCYQTIKKVFTGICIRNNFIDHYQEKCRPLYESTTKSFLTKVKRIYA